MGFFQKLKNLAGIGGVKVQLKVPNQIKKDDLEVSGTVTLTSKSDQHVLSMKFVLVEEYTTGRGETKHTEDFELGREEITDSFDIKIGETKEISFKMPFALLKSNNDTLKEKGGALGALGKVGSFVDNEKSRYYIKAQADVKGVALDPSDEKAVMLV